MQNQQECTASCEVRSLRQKQKTCAKASLIYGCKTWGANVNDVKRCYRAGLETGLDVRQNLNNEIVQIKSGKLPLFKHELNAFN